MNRPRSLSPRKQRQLMEKRGIIFPKNTHKQDAEKIQEIGYYKLKEFAIPFSVKKGKRLRYKNLTFANLLKRYYQDKNLRIYLLHAIENVEVYLNNLIATLLGDKYGAFGYLEFKEWCDRSIPKFEIEEKQFYFKNNLLKEMKRSNLPDIKAPNNQNEDGFPSVWTMVDCLTFGESIFLFSIMSKKNKEKISNVFDLTPRELYSCLKCLNMIRIVCCHNSNLIDISIGTRSSMPHKYKNVLFKVNGNYTNRVALVITLVKYFLNKINPKYNFNNIYYALQSLIDNDDNEAHRLGFKNKNAIKFL